MRKRTKAIIAIAASALCVLAFAGVAYGAIQSAEDSEGEAAIIDSDATPIDVEEGPSEPSAPSFEQLKVGGSGSRDEIADANPAEQSAVDNAAASDPAAAEVAAETVHIDSTPVIPAASTPRTLTMLGQTIPYVDSYNSASAPVETAGIWAGSESTTDGDWGYFVGHHPGVFNCVMDLQNGDAVQVCDNCGNKRTYHVISIYDIPNYTSYEELAADVESHGESITLQTCYGDNQHYRIVEAV